MAEMRMMRTLTLLSGGRGSGANSAPISTRQVEGRRSLPPVLPALPPDISEPPLSAHTQHVTAAAPSPRGRSRRADEGTGPEDRESGQHPDDSPRYNADARIYLAAAAHCM